MFSEEDYKRVLEEQLEINKALAARVEKLAVIIEQKNLELIRASTGWTLCVSNLSKAVQEVEQLHLTRERMTATLRRMIHQSSGWTVENFKMEASLAMVPIEDGRE